VVALLVGPGTCDQDVADSTPVQRRATRQLWTSCPYLRASVTEQYNSILVTGRWHSAAGKVTVGKADEHPVGVYHPLLLLYNTVAFDTGSLKYTQAMLL